MAWKSLMMQGTYHTVGLACPPSMIHMGIRATADELLKEYKACESPDYISYVRAHLSHSPPCVTGIFRDPTMANRQVNASISDVM